MSDSGRSAGGSRLSHHGLSVVLPPGWDGAIYRREPASGESSNPVCHLASFALPARRGDFGGGAVEQMGPDDVFVAVLEYDAASVSTALFADQGRPGALTLADFSPNALQRRLPGQAGVQRFVVLDGRPLCLYVVLGSYARGPSLIAEVNQVVASLSTVGSGTGVTA